MQCQTPKCTWIGDSWYSENEAYVCPKCGVDESGLALLPPASLIGRWVRGRSGWCRIVDHVGGNTFRIITHTDSYHLINILSYQLLD